MPFDKCAISLNRGPESVQGNLDAMRSITASCCSRCASTSIPGKPLTAITFRMCSGSACDEQRSAGRAARATRTAASGLEQRSSASSNSAGLKIDGFVHQGGQSLASMAGLADGESVGPRTGFAGSFGDDPSSATCHGSLSDDAETGCETSFPTRRAHCHGRPKADGCAWNRLNCSLARSFLAP